MDVSGRVIGSVWTPLGDVVVMYDDDDEKLFVTFESEKDIESKALVANYKKPIIEAQRIKRD
jgi:hypothetical protein